MNVDMGLGHENAFEALVAGKTDTLVPNAWGGYFDAGDWDRRVQHLSVAQALLELMELFPQQMEAIALNIPESSNNLPDVLDEALWAIDFYQRLQHPDGGVPGGIESAEHPQRGEASWQESLTIMAYAPDIWASYWYASAAAQAAFVVQPYDIKRAEAYEESALRAFAYAEQRYPKPPADGWPFPVRDLRNLAALQFWRLTNQDRWHQIFLQDTLFKTANIPLSEYGVHDQAEAAFLYARLAPNQVDPQIQTHARQSILAAADTMAALTLSTGFAWSKEHPMAPVGWGTSWASPREARVAAWAYTLTQDPKYLAAILRATQFPLGANPDNISYTTGLGERSPQNPLILDQRILGVAPPPGITVYGPLDISRDIYQDYWFTKYWAGEQMVPAPPNWPPTELYIDVHMNPAMSEFTVQETIGPSAYVWGYLAAQP
jgi:endoglucanase